MNSLLQRSIGFALCLVGLFAASNCTAQQGGGRWRRSADRTYVFVRGQMKYDLHENYMRKWIDRPLLHDRSLATADRKWVIAMPSYRAMVDNLQLYRLDGFAFFPETSGRMGIFPLTAELDRPGLMLLPEFLPYEPMEPKVEILKRALDSKAAFRIDGKAVITSYRATAWPTKKWVDKLAALRKEVGDTFLFLPTIDHAGLGWHTYRQRFHAGQALSAAEEKQLVDDLRGWLEVADGLYYAGFFADEDRHFDDRFYGEFVIPVFKKALSTPTHRNKLLGLSAKIGHLNVDRLGVTLREDGTRTLRRSMEVAMAAEPDVIVLPEWDEFNENTCIRPTVMNGFSTQRVLRYYMSKLRAQKPTPNPGDDTSAPNLIVSFRKMQTYGEAVTVEVLNVPDGTGRDYEARVSLADVAGRPLAVDDGVQSKMGRWLTMPAGKLTAHTVSVPAIVLAKMNAFQAVQPVVQYRIDGKVTTVPGLHAIRLRGTWNHDYKWVKQTVRDIAPVTGHSLSWIDGETLRPGERAIAASVVCDEPMAHVELLEDDDAVVALDPKGTYFRTDPTKRLIQIELRSQKRQNGRHGTISFEDMKVTFPAEQPDGLEVKTDGNRLSFSSKIDWYLRRIVVAVDRDSFDKGRIVIESNFITKTIPMRWIADNEIYSVVEGLGKTLTVSTMYKAPAVPERLNRKTAEFRAVVKPELPSSTFHLRVVTVSGKTWRSGPLVLPGMEAEPSVPVRLAVTGFADRRGPDNLTLNLPGRQVPDVRYTFDPKYGQTLCTPYGRPFWAVMGGFTASATGRGGNGGGGDTPFLQATKNYPKAATKMAPDWVTEDGRAALKFNGNGQFVLFPQSLVPRHAGWHLWMTVKPTATRDCVLFIHHGHYIGSIVVTLEGGKLAGSFTGEKLRRTSFKTDLAVPVGKWSDVEVICDQKSVVFKVGGKASERFTIQGPGLYDKVAVFGGFGAVGKEVDFVGKFPGWFEGYLSAFRMRHSPE